MKHLFFKRNRSGRDLIVGDIHGNPEKLHEALTRIHFDPNVDRLFCTGDLVDKGPQSHKMHMLMERPWFHSVMGNHDYTSLRYLAGKGDREAQIRRGGEWVFHLGGNKKALYRNLLSELPYAITLETELGNIALVHAECARSNWLSVVESLYVNPESVQSMLMYGEKRLANELTSRVMGVRAVIVGHRPQDRVRKLGNTHYIETCGWMEGRDFTILNADTLEIE